MTKYTATAASDPSLPAALTLSSASHGSPKAPKHLLPLSAKKLRKRYFSGVLGGKLKRTSANGRQVG